MPDIRKPSAGVWVYYMLRDMDVGPYALVTSPYPALITSVVSMDCVNLHVFTDGFDFWAPDVMRHMTLYPQQEPGTWHWMARDTELQQILLSYHQQIEHLTRRIRVLEDQG
jgi:hypothetical protein